ncbi:hypothetical protein F4806DRAFT_370652 [Annulohypoxylon nitens]|nr:hypothetical protein F4806DRAFT_370652 [Annulohypoxylon nitens]
MNPNAPSFVPNGNDSWMLPLLTPRNPDKPSMASNDPRSRIPCRYFARGRCLNGDSCLFMHEDSNDNSNLWSSMKTLSTVQEPFPLEKITRTIGGGVIQFEAGAAVTKVSLPSDFSTVRITELPAHSTKESVEKLLRSEGLVATTNIQIWMTNQGTLSSALVKVEDPDFAKSILQKFGPFRSPTRIFLRPFATQIETSVLSDSNVLQIDCKKLHVSWPKPTKNVWLYYDTGPDPAHRVKEKVESGRYKILNRRVQCGEVTWVDNSFPGWAKTESPLPKRTDTPLEGWGINLTQVPIDATTLDVDQSIRYHPDKPDIIALGYPSYPVYNGGEGSSEELRLRFAPTSPIESWELVPNSKYTDKYTAIVRFQNEDDAREAVRVRHLTDVPFDKPSKLTVKLVYTAKFKVAENIYRAVQTQLNESLPSWKASNLRFRALENSDPPRWYRVLKIEGWTANEVAEAMNTIANITSGMVAREGSSMLWHPEFCRNGPLSKRLELLGSKNDVVIVRDKAKSQIRLYGPQTGCKKVQADVVKLLKDMKTQHFYINLDVTELDWVLRGGWEAIEDEIGPEKVNLEITTDPERLTMFGTAEDYYAACRVIGHKEVIQTEMNGPIQNPQNCCVCWTETENPIQTRCSHIYCVNCFENLCTSSVTKETLTKVCCVGESATCAKILSLAELQENLPSNAYEELLEKSLTAYIRHHPESFRNCPSVDCGYLYRVSTTRKMQTCPHCLVPVCTACHCQHGKMTCADYEDLSTGRLAAFEKLKKEIGIKDCPRCKTPLEKTDGCNHMNCICGVHICWVCLKVFDDSTSCYLHMRDDHNGIGLGNY